MDVLVDADSLVYSSAYAAEKAQGSALMATWYLDQSILDIVIQFDGGQIFLTPDVTFRTNISGYKQGRGERPEYFHLLRERLINHWGAVVCDNIEADDMLSILGWKAFHNNEDVVLSHIDKDIDQVPGKHHNFRKNNFYYLTKEQADFNFWKQMLMGDQADNIQGIPGCGSKNAEKILNESEDWESTVREIYSIGRQDYDTTYKMLRLLE